MNHPQFFNVLIMLIKMLAAKELGVSVIFQIPIKSASC